MPSKYAAPNKSIKLKRNEADKELVKPEDRFPIAVNLNKKKSKETETELNYEEKSGVDVLYDNQIDIKKLGQLLVEDIGEENEALSNAKSNERS